MNFIIQECSFNEPDDEVHTFEPLDRFVVSLSDAGTTETVAYEASNATRFKTYAEAQAYLEQYGVMSEIVDTREDEPQHYFSVETFGNARWYYRIVKLSNRNNI
jgi:hypothetical protein